MNTGCVPSKNLLAAAEAYHTAGHHPFEGMATRQEDTDLARLLGMKDEVVSFLRGWNYKDFGANAGDVIIGAVYAVKFGLRVEDLADTRAPYLTMSEGLKLAAQSFTVDVDKLSCCAA